MIYELAQLKIKALGNFYKVKYQMGFNKSLNTKKLITKTLVLKFVKNLYMYLSSGGGENNSNGKSISIEDLYNSYIDYINWTLNFNKEEVPLNTIDYFFNIQLDYLKYQRNNCTSFIYLNEEEQIYKLEIVLDRIREFSHADEYFTLEEFKVFINGYKSRYLHTAEIDIFKNVGKLPKRLKKRKRII